MSDIHSPEVTALLALVLIVSGMGITYVAVGIARGIERRKNRRECDEELAAQRRRLQGGGKR
jgi:hypothetical protein